MEQTAYRGFKDLNCWKKGRELRTSVSRLVKAFPSSEKFELTSQLVRASRSVTANIAEGYGRYTYIDTRRFVIQARGSVTEVLDHLTTAQDEGYIDDNIAKEFENKCEVVFRLINGYINYLDKSQQNRTKQP